MYDNARSVLRNLIAPLYFRGLWMCPPLAILALYGGAATYGLILFKNSIALKVGGIFVLGCMVYLVAYKAWLGRLDFQKLLSWQGRYKLNSDWWISIIAVSYFVMMMYALGTAPKIALIEALRGGNAEDIAIAREMLFKSRIGWEGVLVYLNAVVTSALIPYALVVAYLERKFYRHWLLWLFVLSLLPSMEKALVIKAFLPLVLVTMNHYLSRRLGLFFLVAMIGIILAMTAAAKVGHISPPKTSLEETEKKLVKGSEGSALSSRFELIDSSNPVGYVLNRTLWIPYLTAYDWIIYYQEKMDSQLLYGRTSTVVSMLTGQPRFNMEREVSLFEYGESKTGTSNAAFLLEAYVNFSWAGVVLSSILVALFTRVIVLLNNPAAKACYYYFIYQLVVGPLFGVMFSEGMLLFMVMVIFIAPPQGVESVKENNGNSSR